MAKQIVHGEQSRQAILRGVNQLADAVVIGPQGRNVILDKNSVRRRLRTASRSPRKSS